MPASIPSISTSTGAVQFGAAITIQTNRENASYTHRLDMLLNNGKGQMLEEHIASDVGASITWTPPLDLMEHIPNAASGRAKIRCYTYDRTGAFVGMGFSDYFTISVPDSAKPVISSFTASRINNGVPDSWGLYIKGVSQAKLTTVASGQYGATIQSYRVWPASMDLKIPPMYDAVSTTGILTQATTYAVYTTVTDSRGLTASQAVRFEVVDYAPPVIQNAKFERCLADGSPDDDGAYLRVSADITISSCKRKNTYTAQVQYRRQGGSAWTTVGTYDAGGAAQVFDAGLPDSACEVRLVVTDALKTSTAEALLDIGIVIYDYDPDSNSLRFLVPVSFAAGGEGGTTGAVDLSAADVGATTKDYVDQRDQLLSGQMVKSVNGQTPDAFGNVVVSGGSGSSGVSSINGKTGALTLPICGSATCGDGADVVAKVAVPTSQNFTPVVGAILAVTFLAANTAENPTLQHTSFTAPIVNRDMVAIAPRDISVGVHLFYRGSAHWVLLNPVVAQGADGVDGEDGGYYKPVVAADGTLHFIPSKSGMPAVPDANIMGPQGESGEAGPQGPKGNQGAPGADGGYYTPVVTQVIAGSMHIAFAPSNDSMPVIPPVEIPLPVGPAGVGLPTATESDDGKIPVVRDGDYVLEAMAGGSAIIADGYCGSAAGAVDKYEQGFISSEIVNGSAVCIYFAFDNAAQYPTLQVNGVQGPIFGKNATAINSAALTKGMHLFVYFDRYHAWFMLDSAASAVAAAVERGLET